MDKTYPMGHHGRRIATLGDGSVRGVDVEELALLRQSVRSLGWELQCQLPLMPHSARNALD